MTESLAKSMTESVSESMTESLNYAFSNTHLIMLTLAIILSASLFFYLNLNLYSDESSQQ